MLLVRWHVPQLLAEICTLAHCDGGCVRNTGSAVGDTRSHDRRVLAATDSANKLKSTAVRPLCPKEGYNMLSSHRSVKWAVTAVAVVAAMMLASAAAHAGTILYVDDDAPTGGDGTTWKTAYQFLQDALTGASGGGVSEIRVAQGAYLPDRDEANPGGTGDREATFQLINAVSLMGGYAGLGAPDPDARDIALYETILSGDLLGDDGPNFANNGENSYHVTNGSNTVDTAVLDGFTITAGNANGLYSEGNDRGAGAGLYSFKGSHAVANCTFEENFARRGGGMYNDRGSPMITECTFSANTATQGGGGLSTNGGDPTIANCTFSANIADGTAGGGLFAANSTPMQSNPSVINCVFIGNTATTSSAGVGAAIFSISNNITISDCTLDNNHADRRGGAIYNAANGASISNSTFSGNDAGYDGGAIYDNGPDLTLDGCTLTGNTAEFFGGAMYNTRSSSPMLVSSTFTGNSASAGGAIYNHARSATLIATTFDENSAGIGGGIYSENADPALTDCSFSMNDAIFGGGMYNDAGNPSLTTCLFDDNYALLIGAGLYNNAGSPTLSECTFSQNFAVNDGGGMYNLLATATLTNCTFYKNAAGEFGGGMYNDYSTLTLTDSTFLSNEAFDHNGGGMYNSSSSLTVTNCTMSHNRAAIGDGGAMFNSDSSLTVGSCTFDENSANNGHGGAIFNDYSSSILTNCTFSGNTAAPFGDGGGMFNEESSPILINCTFCANSGRHGGGMYSLGSSRPTVVSSIFWNNSADQEIYDAPGAATTVEYSDVEGGWPGVGNIATDPLFVDGGFVNCRLAPSSPCIDAGDNTAVPKGIVTDLDDNPRFVDDPDTRDTGNGDPPVVDMGAYEFQGITCPWDLDGTGSVGILDLLALLAAWGTDPGGPPDFDGDGTVGILDLLTLLANWGACR